MRRAFTLIELVLVLALLVIIAAITIPNLELFQVPGRLNAASDLVREKWATMRGKAMLEGRAYCFEVQDGTGKFRIVLHDDLDAPIVEEGELPRDVLFSGGGDSGWRPTVVYLPDGTGQDDVKMEFGAKDFPPILLHMRAISGAVTQKTKEHGENP